MRWAIWYHLYNLKNVKNTHGGVLILVKLQALLKKVYFLILNKILTTFGKISDLEGTLETELSCHLILRFSCYFQSCWYRTTDLETSVFNIL